MPNMFSSVMKENGMDTNTMWKSMTTMMKSFGAAANAIMGRNEMGHEVVQYGTKYQDALRQAGEHARLFPKAKEALNFLAENEMEQLYTLKKNLHDDATQQLQIYAIIGVGTFLLLIVFLLLMVVVWDRIKISKLEHEAIDEMEKGKKRNKTIEKFMAKYQKKEEYDSD